MPPTPAAPATTLAEIVYPESDGRPLGETGWHIAALMALHAALEDFLAERPDAYVASNMFLYYEEGNPKANRSPDCMVCLGVVGTHLRETFKTWVEGVVPAVIFEIASPGTFDEDLDAKRSLYARLGVREYFCFDPDGDCFNPRLLGFRLEQAGAEYSEIAPEPDGDLICRVLGLRLHVEDILLRLIDLRDGTLLPTFDEARRSAHRERSRAEEEHRRAEEEHQRAEEERLRAAHALRLAEDAATREAKERERAEGLEAEVAKLRALLETTRKADAGD